MIEAKGAELVSPRPRGACLGNFEEDVQQQSHHSESCMRGQTGACNDPNDDPKDRMGILEGLHILLTETRNDGWLGTADECCAFWHQHLHGELLGK